MEYKLGDCLQEGITTELLMGDITEDFSYLKCSLMTLALEGHLSFKHFEQIKSDIRFFSDGEEETLIGLIANSIREGIEDEFPDINNSEDLYAALNEYTIPDWIIKNESFLYDILPNARIVDDGLYYIYRKKGARFFRYTKLKDLHSHATDFSLDLHDDVYVKNRTEFEPDLNSYTISHSYSYILGFNPYKRVLYLSSFNSDESYTEYYVDSFQEEKVFHSKCYGVMRELYPIINENGKLVVVADDDKLVIDRVKDGERYIVGDEKIYVKPRMNARSFFAPYYIYPNSELEGTSIRETQKYLINEIHADLFKGYMKEFKEYFDTHIFNFDNFREITQKLESKFDENGCWPYYKRIIGIVEQYFDDDEIDCIDLFYVILDLKHLLAKDEDFKLDEEVCKVINDIHVSGKLDTCRNDIIKFREIICEHVYPMEIDKTCGVLNPRPEAQIGSFELTEDGIKAKTTGIEKGRYIGNQIVPEDINAGGIVSYSKSDHCFYIQYTRLMSDDDIETIQKAFQLEESVCRYIIEERN